MFLHYFSMAVFGGSMLRYLRHAGLSAAMRCNFCMFGDAAFLAQYCSLHRNCQILVEADAL